jgi:hypothetical protein
MISIQKRQPKEVIDLLALELACDAGSDALQRAMVADHIRGLVYGSWIQQRRVPSARPIHTTRLLTSARRVQSFVWPQDGWEHETEGDLSRQVLNSLEAAGDIVSTGGGHWVPGPLLLVELDETENVMVLGGFPGGIVQQRLGVAVKSAACFRRADRKSLLTNPSNKEILHPIDRWFGHTDPLKEWTLAVLKQYEVRLSGEMGLPVDQFEIYAPEILRDQRKAGRWMPAAQVVTPLEGLRLCRPVGNTFGAIHFLGTFHFKDGSLVLARSTPIAAELTRRLRFGLDSLLKTPRPVSIPLDTKSFSFDNSIALPEVETRVLSLAWRNLQSPTDNSSKYVFHLSALPLVLRALERLCITPTLLDRSVHA